MYTVISLFEAACLFKVASPTLMSGLSCQASMASKDKTIHRFLGVTRKTYIIMIRAAIQHQILHLSQTSISSNLLQVQLRF